MTPKVELAAVKTSALAYVDAGSQIIAKSVQANVMQDADVLTIGGDAQAPARDGAANAGLAELDAAASAALPDGVLALASAARGDLVGFVAAWDAAREAAGPPAPLLVESGIWADGSRADARPDLGFPKDPATSTIELAKIVDPAQAAEALATGSTGGGAFSLGMGGNLLVNSAAIVDVNEATGTLIVGGDYFRTNIIAQINGLAASGGASARTAGSVPADADAKAPTHNVAQWSKVDFPELASGAEATPNWKIHFVSGDYFDVKAVTQVNWLVDDDSLVHVSTVLNLSVEMGANGLYNVARFADDGPRYDLIVVLGDFHELNAIIQRNLLYDVDQGPFDLIGGLAGGFGWNGDLLLNDATIRQIGGQTFHGLTDGHRQLMDALSSKAEAFAALREMFLAGDTDGTLDVLFVTGDYFDINVISQTNVLSDADLYVRMFGSGKGGGPTYVSSGDNALGNFATIVNVGTLSGSQFVGGQVYQNDMLFQAELAYGGGNGASWSPGPPALAPEIVAFLDHGDTVATDGGPQSFFTTHSINQDVIASISS